MTIDIPEKAVESMSTPADHMEKIMEQRNSRIAAGAVHSLSALTLAAALACSALPSFAVQGDVHQDRVEARIKDMHAKLEISAAQEAQWSKLTEVMRENAKTMDALTQARFEKSTKMTAVDDLQSYSEIAEAHAAGMKKFTPVFAELYNSMSDSQKKDADALFRRGAGKHAAAGAKGK